MANLNIRIDDTLKQQADFVLSELGLNFTTATTMFLKQVVRQNAIPFEVRLDPFWSAENQAHLAAALARMNASGGTVHELIEDPADD